MSLILEFSQTLFRKRLTRAIILPIILLAFISGVSIWQITELLSALRWVTHSAQVISQGNYSQKLLLDMETGFRGYLLTGNQEFLQPYEQAQSLIEPELKDLKRFVSDNPNQVQRVTKLIALYQQWKQQLLPAITHRQQGQPESLSDLQRRKQVMDQMRQQLTLFIIAEEKLRDQRTQKAEKTTHFITLSTVCLALIVGAVLAYFISRQIIQVSKIYENALRIAQVKTQEAQQSAGALQQELIEHQQAEIKLREQEQQFRSTFNQAAVGIAHVSLTGQWLRVNQKLCEILGYTNEQLLARTFQEITYPDDLTIDLNYVARMLNNQIQTYSIEKRYIHQNNFLIWVNLTVSLVRKANGEPKYFISVVEDISQRKQIEAERQQIQQELRQLNLELEQRVIERTAQLQEINQELETFTYSVSHDLRAPLRTIQGFAVALLEDCGSQIEDFCKSYIDSIIDDAAQMNQLISDLLAYSRLTRTEIILQPTALDQVLDQALKQLTTQIEEKHAQIQIALPLPQVMAHRSTLIQVIVNLLSNALKFIKPDIQPQIDIFVTTERQDNQDWIKLSIVDNGIGIAPEHQERVFQVFERLHGAESYPGTGIGLAIVRKGLERMGGRVGVQSLLGQGSHFWIALPKAVLL
ncbi:sensor histidine kinase [Gloeothece verrucosa]|uniref:histidine kinase n=1 Tax=Gloeothece verrucosa (strain PCC 7822) TaxID=497965 RepID=E0UL03_GLOV7|nr:sensor histidine kinase [Gloeothece verrucosa]ADN17633.1 multi-sensor signal transduction histidine kinase [Gloeothece verrucosa PCC 7822]